MVPARSRPLSNWILWSGKLFLRHDELSLIRSFLWYLGRCFRISMNSFSPLATSLLSCLISSAFSTWGELFGESNKLFLLANYLSKLISRLCLISVALLYLGLNRFSFASLRPHSLDKISGRSFCRLKSMKLDLRGFMRSKGSLGDLDSSGSGNIEFLKVLVNSVDFVIFVWVLLDSCAIRFGDGRLANRPSWLPEPDPDIYSDI